MKKIILFTIAAAAFGISSCKKDRECTCTKTTLNSVGTTTIDPPVTTTLKKIKNSDAKSFCQREVIVSTNNSNSTTTTTNDCKLK